MEKTYQLKVSEEELRRLIGHHADLLSSNMQYASDDEEMKNVEFRSQRIRDLSKRLVKADKPNGEAENEQQTETEAAPATETAKGGGW